MQNNSINLFLVRHGNTFEPHETCVQVGSGTDLSLARAGREQAEEFSSWFDQHHGRPSAIYAGPLKRHKESAEIVSRRLGVSCTSNVEALNEVDFWGWEGKTPEQILEEWPEEYEAWQQQAVWPENIFKGRLSEKLSLIEGWFEELREVYPHGSTIIAYSSGGTIRYFYSFLKSEWKKLVRDKAVSSLKVKTGNYCQLEITRGSIRVISWNKFPKA